MGVVEINISIVSAFIAVVAVVASIINLIKTAEYYSLASRPYIVLEKIINIDNVIAIKIKCLQSPLKIESLMIASSPTKEFKILREAPFKELSGVRLLYFPKEEAIICTDIKYPSINKTVNVNVVINYRALSGRKKYVYQDNRYFWGDGSWKGRFRDAT